MSEAVVKSSDLDFLQRVAEGGEDGVNMGYGDTSATMRLTEAGLVRWEQASPFVARVWITENGRKAADDA